MKPKLTTSLFATLLAFWGGVAIPAAQAQQLRPEAEAARLVSRARESMHSEQWMEARESFEKILAIDIELPLTFHYQYALTLLKTGAFDKALERLSLYLNDDEAQEDEFYSDALALFNDAEASIARQKAAEEAERQRALAEQKAKREAEEAAQQKALAEQKAKQEAEARAKRESEERASKELAERKRVQALRAETRRKAEAGDAAAAFQVAQWYRNGSDGVRRDLVEARKWYEKAAKTYNADGAKAMLNLGALYGNGGGGLKVDKPRSRVLGFMAAYLGDPEAVRQSSQIANVKPESLKVYMLAEAGNPRALTRLGDDFLNGNKAYGLGENYNDAKYFYERATAYHTLSVAGAHANLGWMYDNGKGVSENKATARAYYTKAATLRSSVALRNLGLHYEYGKGVAKDKKLARDYYIQSAWSGNSTTLGDLKAHLIKMSLNSFVKYTQSEANKGKQMAQLALGNWYYHGDLGLAKNYAEAKKWYELAAQQKTFIGSSALSMLGTIYYSGGHGVAQNFETAKGYYLKAIELGEPMAMYNLGVIYENVLSDREQAIHYYKLAGLNGNLDGFYALEKRFGFHWFDLVYEQLAFSQKTAR